MKKLLYALGACMLLGLFFSCVDPVNQVDNPNYDPIKEEVHTQFVLNIAAADPDAKTKQSAAAVQQPIDTGGAKKIVFRGLNNASLFCFALADDGKKMTDATIAATATTAGEAKDYIDLSKALLEQSLDPNNPPITTGSTKDKSRRILDINLKTGINTLLFYGQAVTDTTVLDGMNDFGLIDALMDTKNMNNIGSWAKPRLPQYKADGQTVNPVATTFDQIEQVIEAVYNTCFKLGVNGTEEWNETLIPAPAKFGDYDMSGVLLTWKDYGDAMATTEKYSPIPALVNAAKSTSWPTNVRMAPFEELLGNSYNAFMTVRPGELRSGGGLSVARQMNDLYIVMSEASVSAATNEREEIAKYVIDVIVEYLEKFFTDTTDGLRWKGVNDVRALIANYVGNKVPSSAINTNLGGTGVNQRIATLNNFPTVFDLPLGSSTMTKYTGTTTAEKENGFFYYDSHAIDISGMVPPGTPAAQSVMSVHDYTYPPALLYFGNSPIRVSTDNAIRNSDYLDGAVNWETGTWDATKWEGIGHVTSATRAVAMINNIQYGVGQLKTTVKYSDEAIANGLQDNNQANHNGSTSDPNNVFVPGTDGSLSLTGILIGGQPSKVGWDYLPVEGATFTKMIYDKRMNSASGSITTDGSTYALLVPNNGDESEPNFTLVYDNYRRPASSTATPVQAADVYVALEFQNNLSKDFWGNANIVRQGGTFYLLGKLTLASAKAPFDWTKISSIMPPYNAAGETLTGDAYVRIFMEDFVTSAQFVINETSLQRAYVTVPDLRSSKLSFGLSVDLSWSSGLVFENVIL